MLTKIDFREHKEIRKDIEPLYLGAFPENERPPVHYFFYSVKKHKENHLYAYYDFNQFVGFTYLTIYKDIVYIFFLAVSESIRNKGYGSQILNDIKEKYKDNVLLLCYEEVDEKYEDNELRKKRQSFYFSNGFQDNILKTNEFGVVFNTAYIGKHRVPFEDYLEIFKLGFGKKSKLYIKEEKKGI